MLVLYSLLAIIGWLVLPTLIASLWQPPRQLGRDGFAALIAIAFWLILAWLWLPIHLSARPWHSPWLLALLLVALVVYAALFVVGLEKPPPGYRPSAFGGDFLALGLLAPIDEELLFRGILFAIALPSFGPFLSVLYSALLFTLAHEVARIGGLRRSARETLLDLSFGLVAGALYVWTGTILAPIAAHIAVNAWHAYSRPLGKA